MGLASAMSTALTGLNASESTISVVGNNLANSNTVGFKESDVTFATQFLQTISVGSGPSATSGGTNPQQQGLGTMVAEISPNFSQGTITTGNSPTDLAIQGDGFFIVQGSNGEQLYTRNGVFTTNSNDQLISSTGNLLMGFGVDNEFNINTAQLQPLQIPLGSAEVAQATTTAVLNGTLPPDSGNAPSASVVETGILTDGSQTFPASGPDPELLTSGIPPVAVQGLLSGTYNYYVTFTNGNEESRPQLVPATSPLLSDNQVVLSDIPTPTPPWTGVNIYRSVNTPAGNTNYYQLPAAGFQPDGTYIDNYTDDTIETNKVLDMNGPAANANTLLTDVVSYDGTSYNSVFPSVGALSFTGSLGGNTLTAKTFQVTATSTLGDLATFLQQALGIYGSPGPDSNNPIPDDPVSGLPPGATITASGQLQIVGNNGTDNSIGIGLSSMTLNGSAVSLPFNAEANGSTTYAAGGLSVSTDMIAYDSLGMPLPVHITAVLQSMNGTATTYRWFADCSQNDPASGAEIGVGTGVVTFDGNGNFVSASNSTVSIDRTNEPSVKPLQFNLDFSQLSGLAATNSEGAVTPSLSVKSQDGCAPGSLSSFEIGTDGLITGTFTNGISRDLGQIQLARFSNPTGLEQQGQNMYSSGLNSGLPIQGNPGDQGIGSIVSGSLELSNTDIGSSLIDLILGQTMYSSNTRVITTAQQMFDDLLNLIR
jgi:flagellar hook protein FlgE